MTGYLTMRGEKDGRRFDLVIPNQEICDIITTHILALFKETVRKDGELLNAFCSALWDGEADDLERESKKALDQIEDKHYTEQMKQEGIKSVLKYGIACNRKQCSVAVVREKI